MLMSELKKRIYEDATDIQVERLREDDNFGSPQSFFASALHYNLIGENEYERARLHYRDLWNYRGD